MADDVPPHPPLACELLINPHTLPLANLSIIPNNRNLQLLTLLPCPALSLNPCP